MEVDDLPPFTKWKYEFMGVIRKVIPVKPVCAVTYVKTVPVTELVMQLETILGIVDDRSDVYPFSFTSYYSEDIAGY